MSIESTYLPTLNTVFWAAKHSTIVGSVGKTVSTALCTTVDTAHLRSFLATDRATDLTAFNLAYESTIDATNWSTHLQTDITPFCTALKPAQFPALCSSLHSA